MIAAASTSLLSPFARASLLQPVTFSRSYRWKADETPINPEDIQEARAWKETASVSTLPRGRTSYSRSSGPGGQHVNKTETKATTLWSLDTLLPCLPKLLHAGIRESRYYIKGSDGIMMHAQNHRSKDQNTKENYGKLFDEIQRVYKAEVPGEASPETKARHQAQQKAGIEARIRLKKHIANKKGARRGTFD